jgi:hypothetical protein
MNKPILAVTLHQPWASLIAWGLKRFETRSWSTPYRGRLIIHAGLVKDSLKPIDEFITWWRGRLVPEAVRGDFPAQMVEAMTARGLERSSALPLGCAVCLVDLVACLEIDAALIAGQTEQERLFGWWEVGRFAWQLENVRPFVPPLEVRGSQKLWIWTGVLPQVVIG